MSMESEEHSAFEAVEAGDYERAKQLLLPLARQGSANAMNLLGWMHGKGKIEGADKTEGASWYRKAAEGGVTEAFYHSGTLLLESGDEAGAREAFEKGAALGSMQSMYGLGHCLDQGKTESEKREALSWFERAAAKGHFPAQRRMLRISAGKSLFNRIMFVPRLLKMTYRGVVLHWKDKHSEKLY
jgi:TPR repeat protein